MTMWLTNGPSEHQKQPNNELNDQTIDLASKQSTPKPIKQATKQLNKGQPPN